MALVVRVVECLLQSIENRLRGTRAGRTEREQYLVDVLETRQQCQPLLLFASFVIGVKLEVYAFAADHYAPGRVDFLDREPAEIECALACERDAAGSCPHPADTKSILGLECVHRGRGDANGACDGASERGNVPHFSISPKLSLLRSPYARSTCGTSERKFPGSRRRSSSLVF